MKKKALFMSIVLSICLMFSFSCVLATNPVDDIRNFVGGAENVVEDAASGVTNEVRNVTSGDSHNSTDAGSTDRTTEGGSNNGSTSNNTGSTDNNSNERNTMAGTLTTDGTNGGGYSATRTSADAGMTMGGINLTTWTWIILVVAAIGIITLIWSYVSQNKSNYDSYDNND